MTFINVCKFGAQTHEEFVAELWHKLDCLTANKLRIEGDDQRVINWFEQQDPEWQAARRDRLLKRLRTRRVHYS